VYDKVGVFGPVMGPLFKPGRVDVGAFTCREVDAEPEPKLGGETPPLFSAGVVEPAFRLWIFWRRGGSIAVFVQD
jgi:hypothetical protein